MKMKIVFFVCSIIYVKQSYRGKQLHHLIYQRKVKDIQDFSQCEYSVSSSYLCQFGEYLVAYMLDPFVVLSQ